jgi:hypothetical protein
MNYFETYMAGDILTWQQVNLLHKIRNGIYQRNGQLISLLTDFGRINRCYPDKHGYSPEVILYTGNGRRGDQKLDLQNRALLDAVGMKGAVPLFNKLAPGEWQCMGTGALWMPHMFSRKLRTGWFGSLHWSMKHEFLFDQAARRFRAALGPYPGSNFRGVV